MPFPPAPTPGVPVARPPPRRPCAPPAASSGEKKRRPPEKPEGPLSSSWPSATLKRPPGPARAPPQASPGRAGTSATCSAPRPAGSGHSQAGISAGSGPDGATRFSLSLTPEAILVIQRRHLEKQLLGRPRRPLPAPSVDPRRAPPRRPATRGAQAPDTRPALQVSLLNERHKYDDVEYEEEVEVRDEGLVRKCTEWLRGVESAAAARDRAGALGSLPHLSTL
ncbi:proline-rich protein 18 [Heterocephalus glaber]|uniref:Proline-rich protein 18 n=1 Tax=Heterocephalus glaber TaxID=10181 RepID=A0AAX6RCX5_HETGA|nr:proline-rich protein 18 [Heterocephalus glaber]